MAKFCWKLLAISALLAITSIFQMGYTNAYPNTAITTFRRFLNESQEVPYTMSSSEFEWTWSAMLAVYFVGFACGSIIAASVADRIGRKWTLFLGNLGGLLSALIALVSVMYHHPTLFGISRLIMSISAAISMNSLILLFQESSPEHMKGLISFNAEMAFVLTNLIGGVCGMQIVLGTDLKLLIGVSIIPSAIGLILTIFLRESPKYMYLKKDDSENAKKSLKFYQDIKDDETNNKILDELELEKNANSAHSTASIFDIMKNQPHRRGFLLGVATMQLTSSVWPVIFYSTDFLLDAGVSYQFAETVSTTMLFLSTFTTFVGMFVVERFSRKWLLIGSAIINLTALTIFSASAITSKAWIYSRYGCVIGLILHGISYSIALGPIAWFITSELVPLSCRAKAQSLVLAVNHFFALILAFLTFPIYKLLGPVVIILFFVLPGAVCIFLLVIYLPQIT